MTVLSYAEELFQKLEGGALLVNWRQDPATRQLWKWVAFHEKRNHDLVIMADWDKGRPYKADPLPSRISGAFADYLYGEDPVIAPKDDKDRQLLENIIEENDFFQGLWDAVDRQSAEGEVYWRIYTDPGAADTPIIDWHSRSMVVPLLRGQNLVACAFISEVNINDEKNIWYFVEVHEENQVHNRLYTRARTAGEGGGEDAPALATGIGEAVPLAGAPETARLPDVWQHNLAMLAGRVPNRLGRDKRMGLSDYQPVEDLLLDLNEAHSIDSENFSLAGKKRAVLPERFAREDGSVDAGEDIFFIKEGWEDEMEKGDAGPFKILEYSYDGVSSIARKNDLTGTILTRVGLTRMMVDPASEDASGNAPSGTALRTRLIPTTLAARGKTRRWDGEVPYILSLAQMVDALPEQNGGFNRTYAAADKAPNHQRASILPEDEEEKIRRVSLQYTSGLISLEQALKELHPRWSEGDVNDEAKLIKAEHALPKLPGHQGDNPGGGGTGP